MKPYLIGVAGPSCAGKTELARALAGRLGAPILPLDCYYRALPHLSYQERSQSNFDEPDALDTDLLFAQVRTLSQGRRIERPVYDFTQHQRAPQSVLLDPGECVIIEGLFALYWTELRELCGSRIFVSVSDEICLARRLERDVRERGRTPHSVRHQYEATVRPMAERYILPTQGFADLVLSGTAPLEQSVGAVLAHMGMGVEA